MCQRACVCVCVLLCVSTLFLSVCGHKAARKFQRTWHADPLPVASCQLAVVFAFCHRKLPELPPRPGGLSTRSPSFSPSPYVCVHCITVTCYSRLFSLPNNENSRCTISRGGHRCCCYFQPPQQGVFQLRCAVCCIFHCIIL